MKFKEGDNMLFSLMAALASQGIAVQIEKNGLDARVKLTKRDNDVILAEGTGPNPLLALADTIATMAKDSEELAARKSRVNEGRLTIL